MAGPGPMPTGVRPPDPLLQAKYMVTFAPKLTGYFSEISAVAADVNSVSYQYTGTDGKPGVLAQPGQRKPPTITLKRGMTNDLSAWKWHQEVVNGGVDSARVNGTISVLNQENQPTAVFVVLNAWPSTIKMPALQSSSTSAGVEEITLVCEGFERQS